MLEIFSALRQKCALALLSACWLGSALHAQSTEDELNHRLMGKPLYLKAFWRDDKLHFDPNGNLVGTSVPVSFTVAGFDLKKVQLKRDKLILEGRRVGLDLTDNKPTRVALQVGSLGQHDESMHIEIDANPSGDYGKALDAIFVDGVARLVPLLPTYWSSYARKVFLFEAPMQPRNDPDRARAKRIGGRVTAPTLLKHPEPEFSAAARALKHSGNCVVSFRVETDGTVSHVSVVRAIGLGLDEHALAAVQQYTFKPAMQDGIPVIVELNVEVNFHIF
jgi:TonB family protein